MAIEIVVGIAVLSLLIGVVLGYFLPLGNAKKARVAELETALDTAQEELNDYKKEVFGQFSDTAQKFRALDKSYNDLHRQLAQSSVALCGDAATPLLANEGSEDASESEIEDADETTEIDAQFAEVEEAERAIDDDQTDPLEDEILVAESAASDEQSELAAEAKADDVPVLTDVDEQNAPQRTSA